LWLIFFVGVIILTGKIFSAINYFSTQFKEALYFVIQLCAQGGNGAANSAQA
jgi:hypothetical protein